MSRKLGVAAVLITVNAIARLCIAFLDGWLVMLLLGMAHGVDHRVPAFGYPVTFFLVLALALVVTDPPATTKS